jgi:DnaJ-class molecular chaperone
MATCNSCNGTGRYVGFLFAENCLTCGGKGTIGLQEKGEKPEDKPPEDWLREIRALGTFTEKEAHDLWKMLSRTDAIWGEPA